MMPGTMARSALYHYARLMRLHRPVGIWLLLWPTLWALWLAADGRPDPQTFIVFVAGVIVMRSAGCVINDWADRDLDGQVARTRGRPLPSGTVSPNEALGLFAALSLVAVALALQLNRQTQLLAIGGGALTVIYPFMKRFMAAPQLVLGAAFGWAVPMAFAATTGAVPQLAWLLFMAVVVWAVIYDTEYAMVDREDDQRAGIRSTAILFGSADVFVVTLLMLVLVLALALAGRMAGMSPWYFAALLAAGALLLHQRRLIATRDPARCFEAFMQSHLVGAAVFAGIVLHYTFNQP